MIDKKHTQKELGGFVDDFFERYLKISVSTVKEPWEKLFMTTIVNSYIHPYWDFKISIWEMYCMLGCWLEAEYAWERIYMGAQDEVKIIDYIMSRKCWEPISLK